MKVVAVGECMIELRLVSEDTTTVGFGGDTVNTAVYLAHYSAQDHAVNTGYLAGVGDDRYSRRMLDWLARKNVGTRHVREILGATSGFYLVEVDSQVNVHSPTTESPPPRGACSRAMIQRPSSPRGGRLGLPLGHYSRTSRPCGPCPPVRHPRRASQTGQPGSDRHQLPAGAVGQHRHGAQDDQRTHASSYRCRPRWTRRLCSEISARTTLWIACTPWGWGESGCQARSAGRFDLGSGRTSSRSGAADQSGGHHRRR